MPGLITGILSGVAGTALIPLAVLVFHRLRTWYRFRPFHQVWLPFTREPSVIVLTGKKEGHTIKVSVNETRAAETIQKLLARSRPLSLAASSHDSIALEGRNVIAMGSAPANEVTRVLLQSLETRLDCSYTADKDLIVNGELFRSEYRDGVLVRDYALVCKATNPFSPNHKFLVFSGNHGIGTHGGVLAVTATDKVREIVRDIGKADFHAVVEVNCDSRFQASPTSMSVIRCSLLAAEPQATIKTVSETREERLVAMIKEIGGDENYLDHGRAVAELSVGISNAIESRGTDVDIDAVYFGSMLHDIGRTKSNGLDHGLRGSEILQQHRDRLTRDFSLMPDTIETIDEAIKCHIVGGIPEEWLETHQLGIPPGDYTPHSLEAKIVALSDQLLHDRQAGPSVLREAPDLDLEVLKRIFGLVSEVVQIAFGIAAQATDKAEDSR
ncbi:HD domain-containing protein [Candidatus Bipolaricaulota bacterium]